MPATDVPCDARPGGLARMRALTVFDLALGYPECQFHTGTLGWRVQASRPPTPPQFVSSRTNSSTTTTPTTPAITHGRADRWVLARWLTGRCPSLTVPALLKPEVGGSSAVIGSAR